MSAGAQSSIIPARAGHACRAAAPPPGSRPATDASGLAAADQALAILHQVRHALANLAATGDTARIDLKTMPLDPGGLDRLTALLGTGEVSARVEALGPTQVRETAIPGVWLVDYRDADDQPLALHLEIATVPEILCQCPEELPAALAMLDARLNQGLSAPPHPS